MHRPYIIFKHANIAEIRELGNVTISSLRSANYFSFMFLSMLITKILTRPWRLIILAIAPWWGISKILIIITSQPRTMPKPWIKYTWICSPWHVHWRNKWWSPMRRPMMLFWSLCWKTPSFAFQLIALFLFIYLLVFVQKLFKGRRPLLCTTRTPRCRPVRPVLSELIWLLLFAPSQT